MPTTLGETFLATAIGGQGTAEAVGDDERSAARPKAAMFREAPPDAA
jgi:hypothetical protein